jgi:hypothetical protein
MTDESAWAEYLAREINALTIVPWNLACELTGMHDRLLRQKCADLGIPRITFSRKNPGIKRDHLAYLIDAHAQPAAKEIA